MKFHRLASLPLVALALASVVLTGCSPTPAPTPTPTAAFASEEEAFAAAEETYRAYIEAFNAIDLSDSRSFAATERFTAGSYRADERTQLSQMHAEGNQRTGEIVLTSFEGTSTTSNSVVARTCEDVSAVAVTDAEGRSLVAPDRPDSYALEVTFTIAGEALLIVEAEAVEETSCGS